MTTPSPMFVLRDFPGIAALEVELADPRFGWNPANDDFDKRCDKVSRAIFGITEADTEKDEPEEPFEWLRSEEYKEELERYREELKVYNDWELQFNAAYLDFSESRLLYDVFGWDVTDGSDEQLLVLNYMSRQIIATSRGLLGRSPDGRVAANTNSEQAVKVAERNISQWAADIEEEARKFASNRKTGRNA